MLPGRHFDVTIWMEVFLGKSMFSLLQKIYVCTILVVISPDDSLAFLHHMFQSKVFPCFSTSHQIRIAGDGLNFCVCPADGQKNPQHCTQLEPASSKWCGELELESRIEMEVIRVYYSYTAIL